MKMKVIQILSITALVVGVIVFSIAFRHDQKSVSKPLNEFLLEHIVDSGDQKKRAEFAPYADQLASTLSSYSPEEIARIFPGVKFPGRP